MLRMSTSEKSSLSILLPGPEAQEREKGKGVFGPGVVK